MSYAPPPSVAKTTNPGVTDDSTAGFLSGATWANTTTKVVWYCISSAVGAAVWVQLGLALTLSYQTASGGTDGPIVDGGASAYRAFATNAGVLV